MQVTDRLSMATEYEYSHPETESALRLVRLSLKVIGIEEIAT